MKMPPIRAHARLLLSLVALAAMASVLSSCSGPAVRSDHDPAFDFARLRSWNWAPQSGNLQTPAATKTSERIRLDSLVRDEVQRLLADKGYQRAERDPDFLIAWSFGEWQLERKTRLGAGYGAVGLYYPGLHASAESVSSDGRALPPSADPYSGTYEQAKLDFAVVEPEHQKIVWNASIVDDSDFGYYTSAQKKRIARAVESILQGFPPPR